MLAFSLIDADTWPPLVAVFVLTTATLAYIVEPDFNDLLFICVPVAAAVTAAVVVVGVALGMLS